MTRQIGPHRPGDPAFETLRAAADRLLADVGDAIHPKALDLRLDDALSPELMAGERVDTLMLTSHEFGLDGNRISSAPQSVGSPGVLAFTERRMIGAHSLGYVRLRRFVEAFALDGDVMFRAVSPVVDGSPVRMFEVGNGQGWHRIFLPRSVRVRDDEASVPPEVVERWNHHVSARLAGQLRPRWDELSLSGWDDPADETVPIQRPTTPPPDDAEQDGTTGENVADDDSIEPSGPLPRPDLTDGREWWSP